MKEDLLIVVDMQNDFIDGSLANPLAKEIVPALASFIENWDGKIVATKDTHKGDNFGSGIGNYFTDKRYILPYSKSQEGKNLPIPHCIYGTDGYELNKDIQEAIAKVIDKAIGNVFSVANKSSFGYINWENFLKTHNIDNFKRIVLTGTCTDICVVSNALILKAVFPEVEMFVLDDLCAGLTKEKHEAALETMRSCQIKVMNSKEFTL